MRDDQAALVESAEKKRAKNPETGSPRFASSPAVFDPKPAEELKEKQQTADEYPEQVIVAPESDIIADANVNLREDTVNPEVIVPEHAPE